MRADAVLRALVLTAAATGAAAQARPPDSQPARAVRGVVRDASGAPIAGATIEPAGAGGALPATLSGADGSFAFEPGALRAGRLRVRAAGFAEQRAAWSAERAAPLLLVLQTAREEQVSVTASRGEARLGDTAARVVVLSRDELRAAAAPAVDDALRQVPGFSLFRRSGSRTANPTAQGASLRGVGPSGASRTVVLLDGLPLNDPFGGWVYWSRIPGPALERVEVVEGGASDLYGSAALGGVIQALGRQDAPALAAEATAGDAGTGGLSLYAAGRRGGWTLRGAGEAFTSDGYVLVAPAERGAADTAAGGRHANGILTLERRLSPAAAAFVRGALFGESRANGTPLQDNDTELHELSAGLDLASARLGSLRLRGWGGRQTYRQAFSAVAADRDSETLTRRQRVPSTAGGFSLLWSRAAGRGHTLAAGAEARSVRSRSDETVFVQGRPASLAGAGGTERTLAVFAASRLALGARWLLGAGARLDRWSEGAGSSSTAPLGPGTPSRTPYPDRDETALTPKAAVVFRASRGLRLSASAYGAFRAPTLNELYRSFRVGDVLTLANPALGEERLRGAEAGAAWSSADERLRLRAVGFLARVEDPIANVTRSIAPRLITRQRDNLGRTRSAGVELDGDALLAGRLRIGWGYAWIDAKVVEAPGEPGLRGRRLAQVPRHQLTLQARYTNPRLLDAAVQARAATAQFEDDQNRLSLDGYATVDVRISRRLGERLEAFAAVENLTGERYPVGLTPVRTLGPPRLARAGLRFEWEGR